MQYILPHTFACFTIFTFSALSANAGSKQIEVAPTVNGRSEYANSATFTFTIPKEIARFKGIWLKATGSTKGKHILLIDTHVTQGFENMKRQMTQEYLEFTTSRNGETLNLNLSRSSIHRHLWVPGKTMISFLVQGDEVGLQEINGLEFHYFDRSIDEPADPNLIEIPHSESMAIGTKDRQTSNNSYHIEPFFPEDMDDVHTPFAVRSSINSIGKPTNNGRSPNSKPKFRISTKTISRPRAESNQVESDQDGVNIEQRPSKFYSPKQSLVDH